MLKLTKSLIFFDIEATGLDIIRDKIIEISILKIDNLEKKKIKTFKINPGIPIQNESSLIHGIFDGDVKKSPKFCEVAEEIKSIINNCDMAGFNIVKFDLPLLIEEFNKCNITLSTNKIEIIDVQKIFHLMEKRNLSSAYKFYCNKDLKNAHSSYNDALATYEIFISQLNKYNNKEVFDLKGIKMGSIGNNLHDISKVINKNMVDFSGRIIKNNRGIEVFNFGKYKGKSVEKIIKMSPEYYNWIMKGSFAKNTKDKLKEIKLRTTSIPKNYS